MRRAQSYEALEKLEQALEGTCMHMEYIVKYHTTIICFLDYKKALELDPSQTAAREAVMVSIYIQ